MKWFDDIKRFYVFCALVKRFIVPILVVHMLAVGLTVEQVAIVAAVGYIVSLVFEAPSGAIADTLGHKRSLVLSMIGSAIAMALYFGNSYGWFIAGIALYKLSGTLLTGTREALFFERVKELGRLKEHQKLSGRSRAFAQGMGIFFMLTAGIAYQYVWWLPFLINVVEFIIGAVVIAGFTEAKRKVSVKKGEGIWEVYTHLIRATKTVWRVPAVFWLSASFIILIGIGLATIEFHQVLLVSVGLTPALIGLVYACKRFLGMTGALFTHRVTDRLGPNLYVTMTTLGYAGGLTIAAVSKSGIGLLIAFALCAAIYHSSVVAINDYMNRLIGSLSRATTLSVTGLYRSIFSVLLIFVIGHASNSISVEVLFGLSALLMVALFALIAPTLFRSLAKSKIV